MNMCDNAVDLSYNANCRFARIPAKQWYQNSGNITDHILFEC